MSDPGSYQQQPVPPATPAGAPEPKGFSGMFQDPATLAATGLIAAALFAIAAGVFNLLDDSLGEGFKAQLLQLTVTVDVGDVAILGIAVALLVTTPDPPGGIERHLLLRAASVLAGIIMVFGLLRAVLVITDSGAFLGLFAGFVATFGVAIAAFTVAFFAAKEATIAKAKSDAEAAAA